MRTPAEFETAYIPGSYNVLLDLPREQRDELRNRLGEQVVLVCRRPRTDLEQLVTALTAGRR